MKIIGTWRWSGKGLLASVPADVGSGFEGFLQPCLMDMGPQSWEQGLTYGKEQSERGGICPSPPLTHRLQAGAVADGDTEAGSSLQCNYRTHG